MVADKSSLWHLVPTGCIFAEKLTYSMRNQEKKEWAKLLYLQPEKITQKELARRVGVSEKTMSHWITAEKWDRLRQSIILTKEEQHRRLIMQMDELNAAIMSRPEGKRFSVGGEADTLNKLATTIRKLETEASIADIIEVAKRFLNWLRLTDFQKAQEISLLFDAFIKYTVK